MNVQRRAVLTFPGEVREVCQGIPLSDVRDERLRKALCAVADEWVAKRDRCGERYIPQEDVHVYGPFPSMERLEAALTNEEMLAVRDQRAAMVLERDGSASAFSLYLLNAAFLVREDGSRKELRNGTPQLLPAV